MTHGKLIDDEALRRSLRHLRQETHERDVTGALEQVIAATRQLFSATGAGLMLIDDSSMLRFVAATDELGRLLEVRQQEVGRGPCVDALTFDRVTHVTDLAEDDRWPEIASELSENGIRALLGAPVHVEGIAVGALNLYRDHPAEWSDSEISALEAYATLIESLLRSAFMAQARGDVIEQLQRALDSRVVIERAVGVLMGRYAIDAVAAFNRLRHAARSSERKVADVAAELLAQIPGQPR